MPSRPTWSDTWLEVAAVIAKRSLCSRAKVGAVIVDAENRVVASGYNGPPAGFMHSGLPCDRWCPRAQQTLGSLEDKFITWKRALSDDQQWAHCGSPLPHEAHTHIIVMNEGPYPDTVCIGTPQLSEMPGLSYDDCPALHAEANALSVCERRVREGGTIYVTGDVCHNCAKLIANSGLKTVVVRPDGVDRTYRKSQDSYDFLVKCGLTVVSRDRVSA